MIEIYESENQNNEKEVIVEVLTKEPLHNIQFKMIDYYGIKITGSDKTQRMYVEWEIGDKELRKCLGLLRKEDIVLKEDIKNVHTRISGSRSDIIENLQHRKNNPCPYDDLFPIKPIQYKHIPNQRPIPPQTYSYDSPSLSEFKFLKFPSLLFHSNDLKPFWIEVSLDKQGEAKIFLCFPVINSDKIQEIDKHVQVILNNSTKYAILEFCFVMGRLDNEWRENMLQTLNDFLNY